MRLPVKFAHLTLQFWMRKRRHFLQYLGILFMKSMVDANIFHLSYINMFKETRNCFDSCRQSTLVSVVESMRMVECVTRKCWRFWEVLRMMRLGETDIIIIIIMSVSFLTSSSSSSTLSAVSADYPMSFMLSDVSDPDELLPL